MIVTNHPDSILIFIHGVKGSFLENNSNQVWLNSSQAFNFSTPDLSSPLSWKGDIQENDSTLATRTMDFIPILGIFKQDVYGKFISYAKKNFGNRFYSFAYDWRRDPNETLLNFEIYVKNIKKNNPNKKIFLIAHSLGGLLSLALINQNEKLFDKVVFAGTPFKGTISFLKDQILGTANGLNKKILSPEVILSFPSYFVFLPEKIQTSNQELDLYSIDTWKFLYSHSSVSLNANKLVHLQNCLSRVKIFKEKLKLKKINYPAILFISGKNQRTEALIESTNPNLVFTYKEGDERVLYESSILNDLSSKVILSEKSHSEQLSDEWVQKEISAFLEL
jgi:hypothetical protein